MKTKILSMCILFMALIANIPHSNAASLDDYNNWMDAIRDDVPISLISLPGTHDSGSFNIKNSILEIFAETQDRNFEDQFSYGIRFFDIRVRATNDNQLVLHHGEVYLKVTLWEFINKAKAFLAAHPSETFIMSIKKEYPSMEGVTKSVEDIFKDTYYDGDDVYYKGESVVPELKDVRGKIVLLNRLSWQANSKFAGIPYFNWIDNGYSNTTIGTTNIHVQDFYNVSLSEKMDKVYDFMMTLKNVPHVKNYYLSYTGISFRPPFNSPYQYAQDMNPLTARWIINSATQRAGWIIQDYAGKEWDPRLYEKIIQTNSYNNLK